MLFEDGSKSQAVGDMLGARAFPMTPGKGSAIIWRCELWQIKGKRWVRQKLLRYITVNKRQFKVTYNHIFLLSIKGWSKRYSIDLLFE